MEIKCPICGNKHFIKSELPIHIYGDAQLKDLSETICCDKCGYLLVFYKHPIKKMEELNEKLAEKKKVLDQKLAYLDELEKNAFNKKEYQSKIKRIKKELQDLKDMGLYGGKGTRSKEEELMILESELHNGIDPIKQSNIKSLNNLCDDIEKEVTDLEEQIRNLKVQ